MLCSCGWMTFLSTATCRFIWQTVRHRVRGMYTCTRIPRSRQIARSMSRCILESGEEESSLESHSAFALCIYIPGFKISWMRSAKNYLLIIFEFRIFQISDDSFSRNSRVGSLDRSTSAWPAQFALIPCCRSLARSDSRIEIEAERTSSSGINSLNKECNFCVKFM